MCRTQRLIVFLPSGGEFFEAVITHLSLVQSLGVPRKLVQRIDTSVTLLLNLLPCLLE